jgi:hypothetical protein
VILPSKLTRLAILLNCVRATLGFNARELIKATPEKPFNRLHEVLEAIEDKYKPTGSANYQELDRNYQELSLESCKEVMTFASKLQEANNRLLEIDPNVGHSTPQLVNKFLLGLGNTFSSFRATFYQTQCRNRCMELRSPATSTGLKLLILIQWIQWKGLLGCWPFGGFERGNRGC